LGSSGAFLVSLLAALHVYKGEHISPLHLAEEASHIEIDLAEQPVGKQDQYMAAFGGLTCLDIDPGGQVTVTPLHISPQVLYMLQR
ncbi:galactokinase, partial [Desulfobacteraceae bacterium SEEP-SAG9]